MNRRSDTDSPARTEALDERQRLLRLSFRLNLFLVSWNVVEGLVSVAFGLLANSVALIGFGFDSGIEVTSSAVILWRVRRELRGRSSAGAAAAERRAGQIAGSLLLVLAIYIVIDAGRRLLGYGHAPEESVPGIVLTALSLVIMPLIGLVNLRIAGRLASAALRADAYETIACAWLSLTTLVGLSLNAAFGWAWADPLAALLIVPLVLREGLEALRGEECCEEGQGSRAER